MKYLYTMIVGTLAGAVLGLICNASAATTGTLSLSGTIPQEISITVTPNGAGLLMDLTTTEVDLLVASIGEASNTPLGYEIYIKTTNGGLLQNGGSSVAYSAKYDGVSVTLSTSDVLAKTNSTGGVISESSDFSVSHTAISATSLPEGTYTDTVTFTIQSL